MTNFKRLIVAVPLFLLLLTSPTSVHADSLLIASGTATLTDRVGASDASVNMAGANFSTAGSGIIFFDATGCQPCRHGQTVQFGNRFPGGVIGIGEAIDGVKYASFTLGGNTFSHPDYRIFVDFTTSAVATLIVPEGNPEVFSFFVPFTASGSYFIQNALTFEIISSGTLSGQGLAEIVLVRGGALPEGGYLYQARSATYQFTPVPEPGTLALLGVGVGGLLFRLRGRRRS